MIVFSKNMLDGNHESFGRREGLFFVERKESDLLHRALSDGRSCYLQGPRQVGKSRVVDIVRKRLKGEGRLVGLVDLQRIGVLDVGREQWYFNAARSILKSCRTLGVGSRMDDGWDACSDTDPAERFLFVVRNLGRFASGGPPVFFLDEADLLNYLPYGQEVIGTLSRLAGEPSDIGCTPAVCLIGMLPILNVKGTPFETSIALGDLPREDFIPWESALAGLGADPEALLDEVYAWMSGHPAFMRQACSALIEGGPSAASPAERVAAILGGLEKDMIFNDVRDRLMSSGAAERLLRCYRSALTGRGDGGDASAGTVLTCLGLTVGEGAALMPRSRFFATVLSVEWVDDELAELNSALG